MRIGRSAVGVRLRAVIVAAVMAIGVGVGASAASAAPSSGFFALTGAEAGAYTLPADVELIRTLELPDGVTYTRYQQTLLGGSAQVLGGQLSVYERGGETIMVVGAHFEELAALNSVSLPPSNARAIVARDIGAGGARTTTLTLDPVNGLFFYNVETKRFGERWFHWVGAQNGKVLRKIDAVQTDHGTGVKGDTKDMNGPDNGSAADDLTTSGSGSWSLASNDGRQQTHDNGNATGFPVNAGPIATDGDNHWTNVTGDRSSPGQPALVDAQYYANLTDDYFQAAHGLDFIGDCGYTAMQSVAHYRNGYSNAFWDGTYVVYGDGDGNQDKEYSGALDIVAHEYGHAITDCTSDLVYQDEPGALNESFSDMLGTAAEFFAEEPLSTNCVLETGQTICADWWFGEDIDLVNDTINGFRNMADPAEDGDPDHYSELYTGGADNGGVHTNSGIPNHAFYLLTEGGSNAGEARGHSHSGPAVTGIGIVDARQIFFNGFTALTTNSQMCDARVATVAAAKALFGAASQQTTSTRNAWRAVGLTDSECSIVVNTPPTALAGSATTDAGVAVSVDLSGSDPETCELTFAVVDAPTSGSLGSIADAACASGTPNIDSATVQYTPDPGFDGEDSFTYRVNDGSDNSAAVTVSITVDEVVSPSCGGLVQEGEDGSLFGGFVVGSDVAASGGEYVAVPALPIDAADRVSFCMNVETAGTYVIEGGVYGATGASDSFYVTVDGAPSGGYLWDVVRNASYATDLVSDRGGADPVEVTLTAGEHVIDVYAREPDTRLDTIELTLLS